MLNNLFNKNFSIFYILILLIFCYGCTPVSQQYFERNFPDKEYKTLLNEKKVQKSNEDNNLDTNHFMTKSTMQKFIKVNITDFSKENSLSIIPNGDYEIFVNKKLKGELINGSEYKLGIYAGQRVVIAKQKVYDEVIYLRGKTGNEYMQINDKKYRNNFYIGIKKNKFCVINEVELENYLYGVIGKEINYSWNIESIKAQAVVARTFSLANLGKFKKDGFDLCDTTASQVYGGMEAEHGKIIEAVDSTKNEVIAYDKKLAQAFYHSSCGGHTENAENVWGEPLKYLRGISCNYCKNSPNFEWKTTLTFSDITKACQEKGYKVGNITKIKVRRFSKSGRVRELTLFWDESSATIKGTEFRAL
ncbi:MAG: SpoIID/LytB domain-containing protein, partial [Elusimicrobiota bacterium]|nr:SpoIID/LytB domain-containing protein [Elusimicrobiota bacterium]